MEPFHEDFNGFLDAFTKAADRKAQMMYKLQCALSKYFSAAASVKDLYDMASDGYYAAEKAYKIAHEIEDDDNFYFSKELLKGMVKEQVTEALKEFWLNQKITFIEQEDGN